ncbi:MAG: hypothetical protein BGP12_06905 [Rhodospirillales bacterium 70-18]|nr:MAG: hypothetical protein BGP12_06905 [Rhodospirillales bacterium 70-18]
MYDYITAREMQDIAKKGGAGDNTAKIDAGNQTMLLVLRTLDGSEDDLLNRILDLPFPDYTAIAKEVENLIAPEGKS